MLLQGDPSQNIAAAEMFRIDGDHQAAVGEWRSTAREAHAVGGEITGRGDAGNDLAAGTHAKTKQIAPAFSYQAVVRGPQLFLPMLFSVHGPISSLLRLLP